MLRSELFLVIARLSNDAEVLTATMIRFVEQPRFKMDLSLGGGKTVRCLPAPDLNTLTTIQANKVRVPAKLIGLLRSDLPLRDKKRKLGLIILRYSPVRCLHSDNSREYS